MKLVIMRHGQAEAAASSDAERRLTAVGRADVENIAGKLWRDLCGAGLAQPAKVFHSPYTRTTETAQILYDRLSPIGMSKLVSGPESTTCLLGSNTVQVVCEWVQETGTESLLLVSHQPLVSELLCWLVEGVDRSASHRFPQFAMAPASAAILECEIADRGQCQLQSIYHARS